jgi:hypothetical protein
MSAEINDDLVALEQELFSAMRSFRPHQPAIDRANKCAVRNFWLFVLSLTAVEVDLGLTSRSELDQQIEAIGKSLSIPIATLNAYVNFKSAISQYARSSESLAKSLWTTGVP